MKIKCWNQRRDRGNAAFLRLPTSAINSKVLTHRLFMGRTRTATRTEAMARASVRPSARLEPETQLANQLTG